ncbi:DUF2946 family protein [Pontiellaceae bacterium B12219]|nr:DUF2946 family protein [Pontiellaceae bacterium B12219]
MRLIHSSLSFLYLLLAVLLPWLHMPMHSHAAHEHELRVVCPCDQNHTAPASEIPESEEPHDHADCSLCQLTHIPVVLPELWVFIKNSGISILETEPILLPVDAESIQRHQARAPPVYLI